ncbi:hypothetical protein AMJ47_00900 [Parcubacteria bacterium DG_72]|nr:MAG: hypothetical protein AMJ47_00900 [Parcubacteria bacterium DG_72]
MLPKVKTKAQKLNKYKEIISKPLFSEINKLSKKLKGIKIIHINSTPRGGGVAEVLKSLVPLMKGVGLDVQWHTIPPQKEFFEITKQIHNALQGRKNHFPKLFKKNYLEYTKEVSGLMRNMKADIWILHDPQPVALVDFIGDFIKISRMHIDSSSPNLRVWNFIKPFLLSFDRIIFSTKDFIDKDIAKKSVVFAPAINPFTEKNMAMKESLAKEILESFGINTKKPLIVQVSRFDPFKDPIGVIKAYKIAKKKIPNLQLALAGLFLAHDDPEAMRVFKQVEKIAGDDNDIFLFSNPNHLGSLRVDRFVNACQTGADVVLQKSIKEGFGLSVTEAMWKAKPVIGGRAGGIKLQIKDGKNGFLVSSPKAAAKRIVQLLENKKLAQKLGKQARKTVQKNFLMPRLLRDYLRLFNSLT